MAVSWWEYWVQKNGWRKRTRWRMRWESIVFRERSTNELGFTRCPVRSLNTLSSVFGTRSQSGLALLVQAHHQPNVPFSHSTCKLWFINHWYFWSGKKELKSMLTVRNREGFWAVHLSARQAEPHHALEEGSELGVKALNGKEEIKKVFPCKDYQECKCLFHKLFFEMPFPFW